MNRICATIALLLCLGCNKDESLDIICQNTPSAPMNIAVADIAKTRGAPIESASKMSSIGVYCAHTGDNSWCDTTTFTKLDNRCFNRANNGEWIIKGEVEKWGFKTLRDKYTIFSYAPHSEQGSGIKTSIKDGTLAITYCVPTKSNMQPDLMYGEPQMDIPPYLAGDLPLKFTHQLACVSFGVISTNNVKITKIKVSGVISEGQVMWDYATKKPVWSLGTIDNNSFNVNMDNYSTDDDSSQVINSDKGYLMMIPQSIDNALFTVTLDNGAVRTLKVPAGSKWLAGAKYHYVINMNVDGNSEDYIFDSSQISNCYIINPTEGQDSFIQIPIEDRINDFWTNYAEEKGVKITDQSTENDFVVEELWDDFDEYYKFDGSLTFDTEGKLAVQVRIPAQHKHGNLLFAIKEPSTSDIGYILWSWHIWVTDYDPDSIAKQCRDQIVVGEEGIFSITGEEGALHRYKDADGETVWSGIYKDKFIMDRNIGERNYYASDSGAGTIFYQFGRKDPLPGMGAKCGRKSYSMPKRWVPGSTQDQAVDFADHFLYSYFEPYNWCKCDARGVGDYIWYDYKLPAEGYTVGKSIFDPSPLGWRVPVSGTWSNINQSVSGQTCATKTIFKDLYGLYGRREPSIKYGDITQNNSAAYVWSANQSDNIDYGLSLYYSTTAVNTPCDIPLSCGLSVRAVEE